MLIWPPSNGFRQAMHVQHLGLLATLLLGHVASMAVASLFHSDLLKSCGGGGCWEFKDRV